MKMEEKLDKKSKCSSRFYLSNDVVHRILLLLPAKSVGRFRCVTKTWLSISSSPLFLRAHVRNSPITFLLQTVPTKLNSRYNCQQIFPETARGSTSSTAIKFSGEALASCDGLLLLRKICSSPYNSQNDYHRRQYYVLNPITGDRVRLKNFLMSFGWENVGFYFHRWTGEYRLLNLYHTIVPRYSLKSDVLSLGTAEHSWRPIEAPKVSGFSLNFPALVNDRLHWIFHESPHSLHVILAFDIKEETFRLIMLPPAYHVCPVRCLVIDLGLVDINGRLGCWMLRRHCCSMDGQRIELFVMDDGGRRWEEMYSVYCSGGLDRLLGHEGWPFCVRLRSFVRVREGKILFQCIGHKKMHLVEWDFKSGRFCAEEIFDQSCTYFIELVYTESLISPSSKAVKGCR